jgi:hypothetical protein
MFHVLPRIRRGRRFLPLSEELECRASAAGFTPTDFEQLYLEELDDARFNPGAYGAALGLNLSGIAPVQPLAMNPLLVQAARLHSQDMIARNYFDHVTPEGIGPQQRIQATGYRQKGWAESIETNTNGTPIGVPFPANYAALDTAFSLSDLIVDQGVPNLGHRVMLLDIGGRLHNLREAGIGLASQDATDPTGLFTMRTTDTTIDLASTSRQSTPFLTGVVFQDAAGNGEYAPGEGLGGVTIRVQRAGAATTMATGGYSIALKPGTYTVTTSGGGLAAPIARSVVVGKDNVRLDFDVNPNGSTLSGSPRRSVAGALGGFAAFQAGDTTASYSARVDWGNGKPSMATLTPSGSGGFVVNGSTTYARSGTYAVRALITHLSDGQTLALNATAVISGPLKPAKAR